MCTSQTTNSKPESPLGLSGSTNEIAKGQAAITVMELGWSNQSDISHKGCVEIISSTRLKLKR